MNAYPTALSSRSPLFAVAKTLVAACAFAAATAAQAVPITYLFGGSASGNFTAIGGQTSTFSNAVLAVTITTDTSNIGSTRFGAGVPATTSLVSGSLSIGGVGAGSFTSLLYVFNNQANQIVGFGNLANNDLLNVKNTGVGLSTYGLNTAFGPITGTPPNFVSQWTNVGTSFGLVTMTNLDNATFQAAAVPEPQTWGLMAAGLAAVAAVARRRAVTV